ncbi:MAG: HAD-IIB family hydrolase [Pseudomonadales bacterium]|nr:HAD-IIB family hydrolase [Pseudomonadales bacterium]
MELIVFDLDGTLLDRSSRISTYTQETLILLAEKGIAYTVATGRSLHAAQEILTGHGFLLPHIYSNGVLIWDPRADTLLMDNFLALAEVGHLLEAILAQGITPFITCMNSKQEHFIFHPPVQTEMEERLLTLFQARPRVKILPAAQMPADVEISNVSMIGPGSKIEAIQLAMSSEEHLVAYSGPAIENSGMKWMDVHHCKASKGGAVTLLREQLGVSKVICFGDSDNDLSMFAMADEAYAPANALAVVKSAATAVIGPHDADGIAHFLRERFAL